MIDDTKDCVLTYEAIGHRKPMPTTAYDYDERPVPKIESLAVYQSHQADAN
jgi:hypothetical protein